MRYLKIENPGVCPVEGFTLLGASSKGDSSSPYCIGQFGSGNKHAAGVLLRMGLPPIVYCSNHKLSFTTEAGVMKAVDGDYLYDRIVIQHGGRTEDGKSCSFKEPLSQTSNYGSVDWEDVEMALREYVSNAIDATIVHNELNNVKVPYPFVGVEIAVVEDSEVKAKKGFTRVFVPLDVVGNMEDFYHNIGKWFLHFSEPWSIMCSVLPKKNRNLTDKKTAVIYRRGVRVREVGRYECESLFDYNLNNVKVDESRNLDDYTVICAAARALTDASSEQLAIWLKSYEGDARWEHRFTSYDMTPAYRDSVEQIAVREKNWASALRTIGDNVVCCSQGAPKETLARKGYQVLELPESLVSTCGAYKLQTPAKVLCEDERLGRVITEATPDVAECAQLLWDDIVRAGMHANKDMPSVRCFKSIMSGGSMTLGFYKDGCVYINESIAVGQGTELQQTMLEELAHYITGASDETRDLQDWAFKFAVACRRN